MCGEFYTYYEDNDIIREYTQKSPPIKSGVKKDSFYTRIKTQN